MVRKRKHDEPGLTENLEKISRLEKWDWIPRDQWVDTFLILLLLLHLFVDLFYTHSRKYPLCLYPGGSCDSDVTGNLEFCPKREKESVVKPM